jgi:hypothetical protein
VVQGHRGQGECRIPALSRTLMRPLVVKRQTLPESGVLCFFRRADPGVVSLSQRVLTWFPWPGTATRCLPQTRREALASAEQRGCAPLRPRHLSVPSDRPLQSGGSTPCVCQCGPGAGERPHTWIGSAARRRASAGAAVQSTGQGAGRKRLWALTRSRTQGENQRTPCQAAPGLVQGGVRRLRSAP